MHYVKAACGSFPMVGGTRATQLLELVHSNVCGPVFVLSLGGAKYILIFIDDFSRYGWLYTLKHKSDAFEVFKGFQTLAEQQSGHQLKCLRTDNGGEYDSNAFNDFYK